MDHHVAANFEARKGIMEKASMIQKILFNGAVKGGIELTMWNVGLVTHFTIEGDFDKLNRIKFIDLNNRIRINCAVKMLSATPKMILVPLATCSIQRNETVKIHDLRGAIYANVISAYATLNITGDADKLVVRQFTYDQLPFEAKMKMPILPYMDLAAVNSILDDETPFDDEGED